MTHPSEHHGRRSNASTPHPASVARSGWVAVMPMGSANLFDLHETEEVAWLRAKQLWPKPEGGEQTVDELRKWGVTVEWIRRGGRPSLPKAENAGRRRRGWSLLNPGAPVGPPYVRGLDSAVRLEAIAIWGRHWHSYGARVVYHQWSEPA